MQSKTLIVLIAVATLGIGSPAMARGGMGGGGMSGSHGGHLGHGHFGHHFHRNQVLLGGWDWSWPYGDGGYGNTTVVAYPPAIPAANVTGSVAAAACRWNEDTFTVPSSAGGTRPITIAACR